MAISGASMRAAVDIVTSSGREVAVARRTLPKKTRLKAVFAAILSAVIERLDPAMIMRSEERIKYNQ